MEFAEAKPESLIDAKKALLQTAPDDEKVAAARRDRRPLAGQAGEPTDEAVSAWREGLELKPEDHKLLHKCLDAFVADKAWPQALEMLERLIAVEKSPTVRAKYRHAAGLICRDELGRSTTRRRTCRRRSTTTPTLDRSAEALEELLQAIGRSGRSWRASIASSSSASGRVARRRRRQERGAAAHLDRARRALPRRSSASGRARWRRWMSRSRSTAATSSGTSSWPISTCRRGPTSSTSRSSSTSTSCAHEKNRVLSYRALKHLYIQTVAARQVGAPVVRALRSRRRASPTI